MNEEEKKESADIVEGPEGPEQPQSVPPAKSEPQETDSQNADTPDTKSELANFVKVRVGEKIALKCPKCKYIFNNNSVVCVRCGYSPVGFVLKKMPPKPRVNKKQRKKILDEFRMHGTYDGSKAAIYTIQMYCLTIFDIFISERDNPNRKNVFDRRNICDHAVKIIIQVGSKIREQGQ